MRQSVFFIVFSLCGFSYGSSGAIYYRLHPLALQAAFKACPESSPRGVSCDELNQVVTHVNELAYQLRSDPQGFGQTILALQESIATQEAALHKNPHQPTLKETLDASRIALKEKLAIVKWLESPASR